MQSPNSAKLILVADHDTNILDCLNATLPRKGYSLVHAINGEETLALMKQLDSEVELVIIELELPAPSGFEVIGALTRQGSRPTKIIATTGIYRNPLLKQVLGVEAVIRKPILAETFAQTVRAVLSAA